MSIQILLPTPLHPYVGNKDIVIIDQVSTVGEALSKLTSQHPDLKKYLFDDKGNLRSFVNVFIKEDDIRHLQGLKTRVKPEDELTIVPSVAGGANNGHCEEAEGRRSNLDFKNEIASPLLRSGSQ